MTRVMGVDPGLSGAISLIDTNDWTLQIIDMPREPLRGDKNAVSSTGVGEAVTKFAPDYVFIEDVTASPQMGVTSAFSFGHSLGVVKGAVYPAMLTMVRPQDWKSKTRTPKEKNLARRRAMELFPCAVKLFQRVKDDGRAESALLCFYGLLSLSMIPPRPLTLKD